MDPSTGYRTFLLVTKLYFKVLVSRYIIDPETLKPMVVPAVPASKDKDVKESKESVIITALDSQQAAAASSMQVPLPQNHHDPIQMDHYARSMPSPVYVLEESKQVAEHLKRFHEQFMAEWRSFVPSHHKRATVTPPPIGSTIARVCQAYRTKVICNENIDIAEPRRGINGHHATYLPDRLGGHGEAFSNGWYPAGRVHTVAAQAAISDYLRGGETKLEREIREQGGFTKDMLLPSTMLPFSGSSGGVMYTDKLPILPRPVPMPRPMTASLAQVTADSMGLSSSEMRYTDERLPQLWKLMFQLSTGLTYLFDSFRTMMETCHSRREDAVKQTEQSLQEHKIALSRIFEHESHQQTELVTAQQQQYRQQSDSARYNREVCARDMSNFRNETLRYGEAFTELCNYFIKNRNTIAMRYPLHLFVSPATYPEEQVARIRSHSIHWDKMDILAVTDTSWLPKYHEILLLLQKTFVHDVHGAPTSHSIDTPHATGYAAAENVHSLNFESEWEQFGRMVAHYLHRIREWNPEKDSMSRLAEYIVQWRFILRPLIPFVVCTRCFLFDQARLNCVAGDELHQCISQWAVARQRMRHEMNDRYREHLAQVADYATARSAQLDMPVEFYAIDGASSSSSSTATASTGRYNKTGVYTFHPRETMRYHLPSDILVLQRSLLRTLCIPIIEAGATQHRMQSVPASANTNATFTLVNNTPSSSTITITRTQTLPTMEDTIIASYQQWELHSSQLAPWLIRCHVTSPLDATLDDCMLSSERLKRERDALHHSHVEQIVAIRRGVATRMEHACRMHSAAFDTAIMEMQDKLHKEEQTLDAQWKQQWTDALPGLLAIQNHLEQVQQEADADPLLGSELLHLCTLSKNLTSIYHRQFEAIYRQFIIWNACQYRLELLRILSFMFHWCQYDVVAIMQPILHLMQPPPTVATGATPPPHPYGTVSASSSAFTPGPGRVLQQM